MAVVEPLFHIETFAAPIEADLVIHAAAEVAAELGAQTHGPAEVGGGRLLSIWPPIESPTFVSVSARPIPAGAAWVRVSAQGPRPSRARRGGCHRRCAQIEARGAWPRRIATPTIPRIRSQRDPSPRRRNSTAAGSDGDRLVKPSRSDGSHL